MKKIVFILIVCMLLSVSALSANNIRYGVKLGMNLAFTSGDDWDYHLGQNIQAEEIWARGSSVGIVAGGFATLYFNEHFGIRAETNILTKTYRTTYRLRRNYMSTYIDRDDAAFIVEVPLLLVFSPMHKVSILFGPSMNFISSDNEWIASTEFCLNAGLQYHLTDNYLFEVRFNGGLTNLYSGSGIGLLGLEPHLSTMGPYFTFAYQF